MSVLSRLSRRLFPVTAGRFLPVLLVPALVGLTACAAGTASKGASASAVEAGSAETVQPARAPGTPRPLTLWEVAKDGSTSWLFGTCHAGVSAEEALPAEYNALLKGATRFVMEVDPATMDVATMQARLSLPEGERLSAMVGEDLWTKLVESFALGPAAASFDGLHPFALLGYVVSNLANEMAGRSMTLPMDFALSEMAAKAGVEQVFLETLDEQLDLFLGMPRDELIEALRDLTRPEKVEEMKAELNAVLEVCRSGDDAGLAALREKSGVSDWEHALLVRRNQTWAPKLDALFAQGPTFVAVGAGHMFGEDSVVELMRGRGYTVRRLEGVTRSPARVAADESSGPMLPLSILLGQVEAQVSSTLCAEDMVPVQCHGVTSEKCRSVLRAAVHQCAADLELPAELSQETMLSSVQALGPCVVPQFQELLPPAQEVETEDCKAAQETLN